MTGPWRALSLLLALATPAHADDGVYYSQTIGIGQSSMFGRPMQTRASLGARVRFLAIESWIASDTQLSRDGAWLGFAGGEPRMSSDLDTYGISLRGIVPLHRTRSAILEAYARGNAGLASANGQLDGFAGNVFGGSVGLQLRGKVRALGFAWAPLFMLDRGPHVTGALIVDQSFDWVSLHAGERSARASLSHTTLGFAVGSSF